MTIPKEWPKKKKIPQLTRIDPKFRSFLEEEYPGIGFPERSRRLLDELLNGKKRK